MRQDIGGRDDLWQLLPGLAVAAMVVGALSTGNSTVTLGAAAVSLLVAVASPMTGLVAIAAAAALIGKPVLPAPGYPVMMVMALILGTIYRLPIERPTLRIGAPLLFLIAFVGFVFIQQLPETAALYAGPRGRDLGANFFKLVTGSGAIVASAMILRDRSPFPVLGALVLSAVGASIVAVLTFDQASVAPPLGNLVVPPASGIDRASGTFADPNYYGLFIASAASLAFAWLLGAGRRSVRLFLTVAIAVMVAGIVVSQSRSALIALLAGVVVGAWVRQRRYGVALLVVGLAAGLIVLPLLVEWRIENATAGSTRALMSGLEGSDTGRLGAVLAGPQLWLQSPIVGVGLGRFQELAGIASHNYFMTVLAEHGLFGIVLWCLLLLSVVVALRRRRMFARSVGGAVLTVFLVGSLFLEPPREDQSSILIALTVTAALVARWGPTAALQHAVSDRPATGTSPMTHQGRAIAT